MQLITHLQSAHGANHSTENAVLEELLDISLDIGSSDQSARVLLDLTKAFDVVDHDRNTPAATRLFVPTT